MWRKLPNPSLSEIKGSLVGVHCGEEEDGVRGMQVRNESRRLVSPSSPLSNSTLQRCLTLSGSILLAASMAILGGGGYRVCGGV